jgi:hypothetical protein
VVLASQLIDAVLDGTAGGGDQRAWPTDTWAKVGVDPQATARAVIGGWERGDLPGLQLGGLTAEEALALERPAMTMCASSSASGLPGSSGGPGGGGCTAPADAGQASASCSSGHALATVSAADTGRPDTVTAPPAPADTLDTAAAVRLAAPGHGRRLRRTPRADTPATALRNTAAVRAPACDRVRPACRNQHGCGLR